MNELARAAVRSPARALTAGEVAALLLASPWRAAAVYLLAVSTGLSCAELAGLDVGDVNLDAQVLDVRVMVEEMPQPREPFVAQRVVPEGAAGPVARRTVELSASVVEVLAELALGREAWDPLWPNPTGGRQWHAEASRWLDLAYGRAKISGASGFYTLRATSATKVLDGDRNWTGAVFVQSRGQCGICGGLRTWPGAGCWSHSDQLPLCSARPGAAEVAGRLNEVVARENKPDDDNSVLSG